MPIHDWSRVFDGAFHDFHTAWNIELRNALNGGILPDGYYALAEQVVQPTVPDVLTLRSQNGGKPQQEEPIPGATAVAVAAPRVTLSARLEADMLFTRRQKEIVIRHGSNDQIVAMIEILSAGNKSSQKEIDAFVRKATDALGQGYHLLMADLHPRTKRDPDGIHSLIWSELGGSPMLAPADKPLTLAAYDAGPPTMEYVEPVTVGDPLIDMPLFLAPGWYVSVPLEATYQSAYRGVPRRFREVLDAGG